MWGGESWDSDKLISYFGYSACVAILAEIPPPREDAGSDILICKVNSNGQYSVRKGYAEIRNCASIGDPTRKEIWDLIWKRGDILPRVRLFLWKLLQKALPLMAILARRITQLNPTCATCGEASEDPSHFLFFCPFSRACWFAGPLPLRSDMLQVELESNFRNWCTGISDQQWTIMANIMWSIWRCRNGMIYSAKPPSIEIFYRYYSAISIETMVAATGKNRVPVPMEESLELNTEFKCHSDGSWVQDRGGGVGFIITKGEELIICRAERVVAVCALQAETMALRRGFLQAQQLGISSCSFYTDSLSLVKLVSQNQPPVEADWRAYQEVYEVWEIAKRNQGFTIAHVSRCHNELADKLARWSRQSGMDYTSSTYPLLPD